MEPLDPHQRDRKRTRLLYLVYPYKATDQFGPRSSRKIPALVVALVLVLGAFVLAAREAHAEQQSTVVSQSTVVTGTVPPAPTLELPPVATSAVETTLPEIPSSASTTPGASQPEPAFSSELVAPAYIPPAAETPSLVQAPPPAETPPQGTTPLVSQPEPAPLPAPQTASETLSTETLPTAAAPEDTAPPVSQPDPGSVSVTEEPSPPTVGVAGTDPTPTVSEPENPGALVDQQAPAPEPLAPLAPLTSEPIVDSGTGSTAAIEGKVEGNDLLPLLTQRKSSALTTTTFDGSGVLCSSLKDRDMRRFYKGYKSLAHV